MLNENDIKGNINTVDRQLLYDIRELLKEQNELLKSQNKPNNPNKSEKSNKFNQPCEHCGTVHESKGKFLACARKHKKE